MLSKLLHVLGRCIGILMGWRRTHRPGDLTARLLIEHDRALARLAKSYQAPKIRQISNLLSLKSYAPDLRAPRMAIRAERISLIANRSIARLAQTDPVIGKRQNHRVVWLDISRNSKPIAPGLMLAKTPNTERTNVVALGTQIPASKLRKSKAA